MSKRNVLKTMKRLLNLAVGHLHFKCKNMWYTLKNGLSMGGSIAVILTNLWVKEFEPVSRKKIPKDCKPNEYLNGICPECRKKVGMDRNSKTFCTPASLTSGRCLHS